MRPGASLARLVAVGGVLALAIAIGFVLSRPVRLQTGSSGSDGATPVAVVPVGQEVCQSIAGVPQGTHAVALAAVGRTRLGATLVAAGGPPARGTGWGGGAVVVALDPAPAAGRGPGRLCLRNLGSSPAALQGAAAGNFARVAGRRAGGTLFLSWEGPRRARVAHLGAISERVGGGKAQPFGGLLLLVLAVLMVCAWGAALVALAREDAR